MSIDETKSVQVAPPRRAQKSEPHLFRIGSLTPFAFGAERHSLADIRQTTFGRGEDGYEREGGELTLSIPDACMSSRHAQLTRRVGSTLLQDLGAKNGVYVDGNRIENAVLKGGELIELGDTFFVYLPKLPTPLSSPTFAPAPYEREPELHSLMPSLSHEFGLLTKVAASGAPVMVHGSTGTGKELVARSVHVASRRDGSFVALNCGAIPATLVESELFGHTKGAFSGAAKDHVGFLEASSGGTLFLDEVVELPHAAQVALLRVLQEQEVTPVGSTSPRTIDLRIVSATHKDALASAGFREDLYSRLRGFDLQLPTLRERLPDIATIMRSLLARLDPASHDDIVFERDAYRALLRHGWPRNVRELSKCLETALALSDGRTIELSHLRLASGDSEDDERRSLLLSLLEEHGGNVTRVAEAMGKKRQQIQKWLKRFEIDAADYR